MRSNYKRLGDYIREVDVRNTNLNVSTLLGVSIQKEMMPSIANTVGTDMSKYKVVRKRQFAYGPVTSRNGNKISIALLDSMNEAIISQAYTSFEVINERELLPEYLMMWFRRSEFDRYTRFKSHGSAREVFDWDEMCDVQLPVPSLEKQREIVAEYHAVQKRIALNNQLIQKLEETAQAIYKQWFVDFEFPDENGKPYKSNGGEMVESELGEIPKGWRVGKVDNLVLLSQGIQVEVEEQFLERKEGYNRFLRIIDYTPNTDESPRYVNIKDKRYFCAKNEISMIRYGDAGTVCRRLEGIIANNLFKIIPKKELTNNFLYYFLKEDIVQKIIRASAASSTMPAITHMAIKQLYIIIPSLCLLSKFDLIVQHIENEIIIKNDEIVILKLLNNILLSKLSTIEE